MKVSSEPLSAFAVYSEKLKQKKKKANSYKTNGINKVKRNHSKPTTNFKMAQMKEIGFILQSLAEQSANRKKFKTSDLLQNITEANKQSVQNFEEKCNVNNSQKGTKSSPASFNNVTNNISKFEISEEHSYLNTNKENNTTPRTTSILSDNMDAEMQINSPLTENIPNKKTSSKLKKKSQSSVKNATTVSSQRSVQMVRYVKKKQAKLLINQGRTKSVNNIKHKKIAQINEEKSDTKKKIKNKGIIQNKNSEEIKNSEISTSTAKTIFEWLISPVSEVDFMRDYWEKQPLLIQRQCNRTYYSELLSTETIDTMLRENNVCFTKHLDITSYSNGIRETHNLSGRAQANVVWDFYSNGCSVRLLNPQIFLPKIHTLNATLQEYFGSFVGANVYLTPPNSQGFAPHYDDIEAFILQIEGKKHWKVYTPRNETEILPRYSSPNFSQEELNNPFLDVIVEPGDLLYFPRGFIHQASTVDGEHSLHITLSAYQKTAWVDLFEKILPIALKKAAEEDIDFRRGLPINYLGLRYQGNNSEKKSFLDTAINLMSKLKKYIKLSFGPGVDMMGAQFMHDALPPVLTPDEKQYTSLGKGLKMKDGKVDGRVEFTMDTHVKLLRQNICRLVEEEDEVRLYHCMDNPLEYHAEDPQFLVLPPEGIPVITLLYTKYPAFTPLRDVHYNDEEALITLVSDLWDSGLLAAKNLQVVNENNSESNS